MTDKVPQVSEQAAKLLEDLRELLDKGGQFVMEQAPPLAKEIVTYGRVSHLAWIVVCALILYSVYRLLPKVSEAWEDMDSIGMGVGGGLYCVAGVLFGVIGFGCNLDGAIKSWFAPRLYLLDYIMSALK